MTDHHCCSSHSHCEEPSSTPYETNASSAHENLVSSNVIHNYLTSNDHENINDESQTLSQLFDLAWSNQNDLQSSSIDTTADDYSSKLLHTIRLLESLEKRLVSLELFSDNEQIEEISTNNLRYLLLPAFLAWLHQSRRSKPSQRLINVQHACDYYEKFLTTTRNYGLHTYSIPKAPKNEDCDKPEVLSSRDVDMMKMAQDRASKIRGHLKRREEEESMRVFEEAMKNDGTDDEVKRKFYLSKIRWWINTGFDDLNYLFDELRVLLQRQSFDPTNGNDTPKRPAPQSSRPFKPIILTRDQMQSRVIGQGYPSASTMTIDEFYESLAKRGLAPTPEQAKQMASGPKLPSAQDFEKEEIAKEAHVDKDAPDMLTYLRTKDDYKDEHRRGEGNRHNRS